MIQFLALKKSWPFLKDLGHFDRFNNVPIPGQPWLQRIRFWPKNVIFLKTHFKDPNRESRIFELLT